MNITVAFKEISDIIEKQFNVRPKFTAIDNSSIMVSHKLNAYLPTIEVELHIDAMRKDVICLSYKCAAPTAMMISGAIGFIGDKIPSGIEVKTADQRIIIYPKSIAQLEKVLEYVELEDIYVDDNGVNVAVKLL